MSSQPYALSVALSLVALVAGGLLAQPAPGPLSVSTVNPRYFAVLYVNTTVPVERQTFSIQ